MALLNNLSILVTGGAGFIGSNIVEYALKNGAKFVRVVDNLSTGNKDNIKPFLENYDNLEFVYGDISSLDTCRKITDGIDVVCHQAALGSVPRSVDDPLSSHLSNVDGTLKLLIASKERNIKRFVYASSSAVYGDDPTIPKIENITGHPLSPYGVTKCVCEMYARVFTQLYDMECIGLRYFNVFGPRQDPNGAYAAVIPRFVSELRKGISPTINGNGSYSRDFTYIDNVVQANILALTVSSEKLKFGESYNAGAEGRITILELYNTITKCLGVEYIKPRFGSYRKGDIPHSNASIDKAKNIMGYNPTVDFETGIKKTVEYFNK